MQNCTSHFIIHQVEICFLHHGMLHLLALYSIVYPVLVIAWYVTTGTGTEFRVRMHTAIMIEYTSLSAARQPVSSHECWASVDGGVAGWDMDRFLRRLGRVHVRVMIRCDRSLNRYVPLGYNPIFGRCHVVLESQWQ
jgi:hypothetical protein